VVGPKGSVVKTHHDYVERLNADMPSAVCGLLAVEGYGLESDSGQVRIQAVESALAG